MKYVTSLAISMAILGSAYAGPITQKLLDEFVIYDIPVASKTGTTTIMFPSEISGLFAKSIAAQEQENAGFLISFTPGNFYFTIRALKKDAEDHLTVIFNRKAYVLHLTASEKPFYNVTFYQDERKGKDGNRMAIVPERLLSLMDKAKAYPLFAQNHPDALAGVLHAVPGITNYYDGFQVRIRDVWRFEQDDTLIFRLELENTTDRAIYYKPQDLAVRLDERIYTQSLADASGVMPPKSVTPAFFAITGNGQGGRNNLDPVNKWNVLVVRAGSETAALTPNFK
ncbi:MAG: hypothetical protein BGO12_13715 [Verrucomicrobia bacterium 61-8]|nr:hypothetical protein [Verrucomicrobiota bacterium]OJV10112.1 MAG: hypothetical protein BGO12_13715 [Verrucomicrobia bacterium 61-8]